MRINSDSLAITIDAPAKINLFLEVLGKRSDGYHELDTVMSAINLCDELRFEATESNEIELNVETPMGATAYQQSERNYLVPGLTRWNIPSNSDNLVVRAARRTINSMKKSGYSMLPKKRGLTLNLKKRIPAQSGLGGGSSDAAAAIVGTMAMLFGVYDVHLANQIAASLGSDLNFFLTGHDNASWFGRCTGRGEIVEKINSKLVVRGIITQPNIGCATGEIFSALPKSKEIRDASSLITAIQNGNPTQLLHSIFNRLEKPVCSIVDEFQHTLATIATMVAVDGLPVFMTGSGSTIVVLDATVPQVNDEGDKSPNRELQDKQFQFLKEQINARFDDHFVEPFVGWQSASIEKQLDGIDVPVSNGSRTNF